MKQKVCHITSVHPLEDIRIFKKECVSLANNGFDVTLIGCGENAFETIKENVRLVSLNIPVKNRFQRILKRANGVYKKAIEIDADIYHLHDPELILYGKYLKKKGKKVIFDSHEDVPAQILSKKWIPSPFRKVFSLLYALFEKITLNKFDALVSVTPTLSDKLRKINPNTFQITNYPFLDEAVLSINPSLDNSIVFAGGITSQWLHKEIIQAIDRTNNVTYNLAGGADKKYLEELKLLSGWSKVNFVGKIPFVQVNSFVCQSSVGMALCDYSPNVGGKTGSLGNTKLFEYMMAGIPVICTDFVLWKEIVEKNNCGICVNPHDIHQISRAIIELINNKDKSREMGLNGRKLVVEKYNWTTQEKILLKMYNKIK